MTPIKLHRPPDIDIPRDRNQRGNLIRLQVWHSTCTPTAFNSCDFPLCGYVDRVIGFRSTEWRNARDAFAPEITPAARRDGSTICVPAGPLLDCKFWPIGLFELEAYSITIRPTRISSTNKICFATQAVSSHGSPTSNSSSKMAPFMSKHLYVVVAYTA